MTDTPFHERESQVAPPVVGDNTHPRVGASRIGDQRAENVEPKPAVATPFDRCVGLLRFWREEDHADNIALSRHEAITLLEGIYELRRAVNSHADMLAALIKARDSFIYTDDHSKTAVMAEADNHAFNEICAAISKATGAAS